MNDNNVNEFADIQTVKSKNQKLMVISAVGVVLSVLSYLIIDFYFFYRNVEKVALENTHRKVVERNRIFNKKIQHNISIVSSIANSKIMNGFLNSSRKKDELMCLLKNHFVVNENIFQLRFIDEHGYEKIRLDRDSYGAKLHIVPNEKLQNKSSRYYFKKTVSASGKIYISDIDLNIENGKVDMPYRGTYRIGKALYKDGALKGIIVINIFADILLNDLLNAPLYELNLINSKGQIIYSRDKKKRWGFYTGAVDQEALSLIPRIASARGVVENSLAIYALKTLFDKSMYLVFRLNPAFVKKQNANFISKLLSIVFVSIIILIILGNLLRVINRQNYSLMNIAETLQKAQQKDDSLMQLFSSGPIVLFKWKNEKGWPVEYVSENVSTLLGYSAEDFLTGRISYTEIIPKEYLERVSSEVIEATNSGVKSFTHKPYMLFHKYGTPIQVQDITSIVRDHEGNVTHFFGYISDMSEITSMKAKADELERRYLLAMNVTKDGLWDWNPTTDEVYFSKQWKSMLGYEEHEIENKVIEWSDRIHPDDLDQTMNDVRRHLKGETDYLINIHRLKHKDGSWKWILDRGLAHFNSDGHPIRVIGFHTDITEQKNKEHYLKTLLHQKQLSEEIGTYGTWSWDSSEDHFEWSQGVFHLTDMTYDFIPSINSLHEYVYEDDLLKVEKSYKQLFSDDVEFDIEYRIKRDQSFIWVNERCQIIKNTNDDGYLVLGVVRDITDRKEFEQQQAFSFQQRKLASLGEVAAGIAHEINNPLTVIKGKVALINKNNQKNLSPEVKTFLVDIDAMADRISKIIKSMKRLTRDNSSVEFERVSISEIINDSLPLLRDRLKSSDIKLTIEEDANERTDVLGKDVELSQVFINIITNAIDAIETLNEKWIRIVISSSEEEVKISFIDSGKGIDEVIQDKILQPFFSTKTINGISGSGFGLNISNKIIEAHSGTFSLDRHYKHTKFDITLPLISDSLNG